MPYVQVFFWSTCAGGEVHLIPRKAVTPVSQTDSIVPLSTLSTVPIAVDTTLVDGSRNLYKPVSFFFRRGISVQFKNISTLSREFSSLKYTKDLETQVQ